MTSVYLIFSFTVSFDQICPDKVGFEEVKGKEKGDIKDDIGSFDR